MPEDQTPPSARDRAVALKVKSRSYRSLNILFNPAESAFKADLVGDAVAPSQLLPVLKALVIRLETGTLRTPVDDSPVWVDVTETRP